MKSWKTTLAGAIGALGAYFTTLPGTLHIVGQVLTATGTFLIGLFARDNDKSSEDVGAK
jgi:hypothetical protein